MKQTLTALSLVLMFFIEGVTAQNSSVTCLPGFTFEISQDRSWGYKEPVVVEITPGSPAEMAGLKINDIILSVNKNGTYQKSYQTIMSWFNLISRKVDFPNPTFCFF